MTIDNNDILAWEPKYRLKFINSISGYKGVHLIGTKGINMVSNLAIFNSIVHISSEPPRIGFIMRPLTVERDTYKNIKETKVFTINHVQESFIENAHYTSAKISSEQSEFEACNLEEQYLENFTAPFVKESSINIGLKLVEDLEIKATGGRLIIGEIQIIDIPERHIEDDGQLNLSSANDVCVTGLNQYSSVKKLNAFLYAREKDIPDFTKKKMPDNVVFDKESQKYNASMLPYGTNIGAPKITSSNVSRWKNTGINSFNHFLNSKVDNLKNDYDKLIKEYNLNELLYSASYQFEPIIGQHYHLYSKEESNENFLSLIPPQSWNKPHLGSFTLSSDKVWSKL
jgi:flavin reductase (DIM6/NTAB) family NADH-FMN oxidoreductase RutF